MHSYFFYQNICITKRESFFFQILDANFQGCMQLGRSWVNKQPAEQIQWKEQIYSKCAKPGCKKWSIEGIGMIFLKQKKYISYYTLEFSYAKELNIQMKSIIILMKQTYQVASVFRQNQITSSMKCAIDEFYFLRFLKFDRIAKIKK